MPLAGTSLPVRAQGGDSARSPASNIDMFGNLKPIVDPDAHMPNRAFNLCMAQRRLNRPQISGSPVNHHCFHPPQERCRVERSIKSDAAKPIVRQAHLEAQGWNGRLATDAECI